MNDNEKKDKKKPKDEQFDEYKLDNVDKMMLNILLEFPAITNEELGKQVGLLGHAARRRRLRPAFNKALDRALEPVDDILKRALPIAARRLLDLTKSDDKKIALEAAKTLLGPILNRVTVDHNVPKMKVYKTEVRSDGTLVRQLIEEIIDSEDQKNQAAIDVEPSA
jgi:hypothetical protein